MLGLRLREAGRGRVVVRKRKHLRDATGRTEDVDLAIQLPSELCRMDDGIDEPSIKHRLIENPLAGEGEPPLNTHRLDLENERHVFE
jgi:hypothetical protein